MKDREITGTFIDQDGNAHQIPGSVWAPQKELIDVIDGFTLCKSDPEGSSRGMTQFVLRRKLTDDDILRVDLYDRKDDGKWISGYWDSTVPLADFLTLTEIYFTDFEEYLASSDRQLGLFVFAQGRAPQAFEFGRPLDDSTMRQDPQLAQDIHANRLNLVRMETPVGDFCWMPTYESVGYTSPINFPLQDTLKSSLARFIIGTQRDISAEAAKATLEAAFQ